MDEYCVLTWKLVKNGTPMILEAGVFRKLSSPAAEKLSQLFATTARFVAVVAFGMQHGKTFRQVVDSDKKVGPAQRA